VNASEARSRILMLMIRVLFGALLFAFALLVTLSSGSPSVLAQPPGVGTPQPPAATEDPNQGADNPFAGAGQTSTPDAPADTPADPLPEAEITAEATPVEQPSLDERALEITVRARTDLETLASATLGLERPTGWSIGLQANNPQYALLTRLDLELLAGSLLGAETRPDGWFGVVGSTPYALARDIRHDLELLADESVGARPAGWLADEPLMNCDRTTQAAVQLLELNGVFTLQADRTAPDFCQQATNEVSVFMEVNLLANPLPGGLVMAPGVGGVDGDASSGTAQITETFAVGFLDRGAAVRVGVIPLDTAITPVARSYAQFSAMMLVSGDGFELFVDHNTTSVTREEFNALPNVDDSGRVPFCDAAWCEGAD